MKYLCTAFAILSLTTTAALADGKVYVPLPDLSPYQHDLEAAERLVKDINLALVLGMNCGNTSVSDAEHSLLSDSGDILAYGILGRSVAYADDNYSKPAFDALDRRGACDTAPELLDAVVYWLLDYGGSLEPFPDQEKAYHEWRAFMDQIWPK